MAVFENLSFDLDAASIEDAVYEYIEAHYPEWTPREGNLEVIYTEAIAGVISEIIELIGNVPPAVFRYFGKNLIGLFPDEATFATVTATVTANTNLEQTLRAGTTFLFDNADDETIAFQVVDDVPLPLQADPSTPATTATGAVLLRAVEAGFVGNGFTNANSPRLHELSDWFGTITIHGESSGGQDEENDESYQDRLRDRLQILRDGVVLADDLEVFVRTLVTGISRAAARDNYIPGTNEVQKVDFTGTVTGGSYQLGFTGKASATIAQQLTGAIAWNADAAALKAALVTVPAINSEDVDVLDGPGPTDMRVIWKGQYEYADMNPLNMFNSVTGGGSVAITTVTPGVAAQTNAEKACAWSAVDIDGNEIDAADLALAQAALALSREVGFIFSYISPTYSTWKATVAIKVWPGFDLAEVEGRVQEAWADLMSPQLWGQPPLGEAREWNVSENQVTTDLINRTILNVEGVRTFSATTTYGKGDEAVSTTTPKTMPGAFPLPRPGVLTLTSSY